VTYVANLRLGLTALGVASGVVASQMAPRGQAAPGESDVVDASRYRPPFRLRALWKAQELVGGRLGGVTTADRRLGCAVAAAVRTLHARAPLDLFEMEESFGAARFVRGAIPRPMIVRLHGPWCLVSPALGRPDDAPSFQRRVTSEGRAIFAADAVSSPSRHALAQVRDHYGFGLTHAAVIPNAITTQPEPLRWRFEQCDQRTVLFVGRFDRLKGGDIVLGAFARLAREIPEARLVFVGPDRGFRDDAGKTWSFDDYLRAHLPGDLAARVQMLGEQPSSAIAELRRSSFVTMVASRFETFSMTAVEALSHGSPLLAPAVAALVEIVEHGRNGLLFEGGNEESAARQLLSLFRDPALARRLAAAGAEDAVRRYAPEVVARQMVSFYEVVRARHPLGTTSRTPPPLRR